MIYKFRSKATGDLIMLGPDGDALLRLIGREPEPKGIFEPAAMAQLRARLEQAVAEEAAAIERAGADGAADERKPRGVTLRQRVWPMVQMLQRAEAAGEPIVWGA